MRERENSNTRNPNLFILHDLLAVEVMWRSEDSFEEWVPRLNSMVRLGDKHLTC